MVPTLKQAIALHQEGHVAQAAAAYERILQEQPRHHGALTLLGLVSLNSGRLERAVELLRSAVAVVPGDVAALRNLIEALRRLGRFEDALAASAALVAHAPQDTAALHSQAELMSAAGHYEDATAAYARIIAKAPLDAVAFANQAIALGKLNRKGESLTAATRAVEIDPTSFAARCTLAGLLNDAGRHAEALPHALEAVRRAPQSIEAWVNSGLASFGLRNYEDALAAFDRALGLRPDDPTVMHYRETALHYMQRRGEAEECFRQALSQRPDIAAIHYNLAHCLLSQGKTKEGWEEYEWRKRLDTPMGVLSLPLPELSPGPSISGKILLLHAEQGLGDTLKFIRYAKEAVRCGANVIVTVPPVLERIVGDMGIPIQVTSQALNVACHYHCPLLSLPRIFGTIGADAPYLQAQAERVSRWKEKLPGNAFKIGICWQTNKAAENGRSFPVAMLEALARRDGVQLISLQKHDGLEQVAALPWRDRIQDLGPDFDNGPDAFVDAAAVIESLDLVITCDTAIAHLAGGLCCPTWVVLMHAPDWRWGDVGDSTPWYRTVRLFRQPARDDWASVFRQVEHALDEQLKQHVSCDFASSSSAG